MCIRDRAEALEPVIDTALRAALHEAFKTHTIMEAWGSSNEEMRNIPMNQTPVSYTHLDVYKRQGLHIHIMKPEKQSHR